MTVSAPVERDYRTRPLRVILATLFAESYLLQDTLPELARRGVEVVVRCEPKHVQNLDLGDLMERKGVEMLLHMHEMATHSDSERISNQARLAGLPVRALSRKKSSWAFLPAPLDAAPLWGGLSASPSSSDMAPPSASGRVLRSFSGLPTEPVDDDDDDEPAEIRLLQRIADDPAVHQRIIDHVQKEGLVRKEARLRDVVRYYLVAYADYRDSGITDEERDEMLVTSVLAARDDGTFPRLMKVKSSELPKLVRSLIQDETRRSAEFVSTEAVSSGAPDESSATSMSVAHKEEAEEAMPMHGVVNEEVTASAGGDASVDELARLRARVAELEKLGAAFTAFQTLVDQGYISSVEAAERLFAMRRAS